jgi:hypothetical protein
MPATITVAADEVTVRFHRRAHLPIIIDSGSLTGRFLFQVERRVASSDGLSANQRRQQQQPHGPADPIDDAVAAAAAA